VCGIESFMHWILVYDIKVVHTGYWCKGCALNIGVAYCGSGVH
jgi:hypothetical protein